MRRPVRAVLVPLLVLLGLEGAARLADWPDPRFPEGMAVFKPIGGLDEAEVNAIVEGDPDLFWRLKPNLHGRRWLAPLWLDTRTNSLGVRDHEFSPQKGTDEFRVLCLGDSCTYGSGVPLGDSYPQQLEALLSVVDRSRPYEVINAGVPGYTVFQGYQFLRTRGIHWCPDLVIASFGFNENGYWSGLDDVETHRRLNPPVLRLLLRSALLRLLAGPFLTSPKVVQEAAGANQVAAEDLAVPDAGALRRRMSPELYGEYLVKLTELCRSHGFSLVFILHPTRPFKRKLEDFTPEELPENFDLQRFQLSQQHVAGIRAQLRRVSKENDVPLLDLETGFATDSSFFVDNCHLSSKGCKQQAVRMFRLLQSSDLLPAAVEDREPTK